MRQTIFRGLISIVMCFGIVVASGQKLSTGTYNNNGRVQNAIMIEFHGDLSNFTNNMSEAFGKGFRKEDGSIGYTMEFRNVIKSEWSDQKLVINIWIQSNENNHIITFACKERKGIDCLRSSSKSKSLIADFLRDSF